ncbi:MULTISPECIES: class I SAM-dependent methyltransferase [Candidatus Rhabdochlamydia]|nr:MULTISPECIES: class I SAM-dependent methyltransferase [Rhabdochlamydia]
MYVTPEEGQKTGLFLDQREMRQLIFRHAKGKKIWNCFSYTGGLSLFALSAGAKHVTSIDVSKSAFHCSSRCIRVFTTIRSSCFCKEKARHE